jgi:hypothetical protein
MEGDLRGIYGVLAITEGIRTKLPPANRLHLGVGHGVSVGDFGPDGLKYVRELLGHLVNILWRVRYAAFQLRLFRRKEAPQKQSKIECFTRACPTEPYSNLIILEAVIDLNEYFLRFKSHSGGRTMSATETICANKEVELSGHGRLEP